MVNEANCGSNGEKDYGAFNYNASNALKNCKFLVSSMYRRRITSLTTLRLSFEGLKRTFLERFFPH
jgi:hypothetical protein